jgi:hypothetical protein
MDSMRYVLAALLLLLLATPASPAATVHLNQPVTDGIFWTAAREADRQLESDGYTLPDCPLRMSVIADPDALARATMPGCEVYLERDWMADVSRNARARLGADRATWLAIACHVLYHERSHNVGIAHLPNSREVPGYLRAAKRCVRWARRVVRRQLDSGLYRR